MHTVVNTKKFDLSFHVASFYLILLSTALLLRVEDFVALFCLVAECLQWVESGNQITVMARLVP